jgi:16S rRNA (uracil1498-N3)-methyltransferase
LDRVFLAESPDASGRVTIEGRVRHHLADSLRVRAGERFLATDGAGFERLLEVERVDRRAITAVVREETRRDPGPGHAVTLAVAPPKGSRMETAVEKATEIGVGSILPLRTARSVVKGRSDSERAERWARVAAAATAQSGRCHAPRILPVRSLEEALATTEGIRLLAHPSDGAVDPAAALGDADPSAPITLFVGPEGGFTPEECAAARAAGAIAITLGETRLRTETAAIVAVTLAIAAVRARGDAD